MRNNLKRFIAFLLLSIMTALLFSACGSQIEKPLETTVIPADEELTYKDFTGKIIGVEVGAISDVVIENDLSATAMYYNGVPEAIQDIRHGRIAGFIWDLSAARAYASLDSSGDFIVVPVPAEYFAGPLGAFSARQDIIDSFNEFLFEIEENGIKAEAQARWLDETPDLETPMPGIPLTGENGSLRIAICGTEIPFTYVGKDNEYKGYSVELALRFAKREGMGVEFFDMDFSGLIPFVNAGKAELGIANVTITEERRKSILFSESVFDETLGLLALRPSAAILSTPEYTDFVGKKFAVKAGTIYDTMASDDFEASETLLFDDYPSIYEAVQRGAADAGMRGYVAARLSLLDSEYSDLEIISLPERFDLPMGAISMDQDMIDGFDAFLEIIKSDGTYDEMLKRWIEEFDPENVPEMPAIPLTGKNGTLTVNTSSDYMPFSFPGRDGYILGFDIEMANRFAAFLGKDIELVDMAFADILPYLMSGKSDIAISYVTITEERKRSVLFTEPYFVDKSAIIYKQGFGTEASVAGPGGGAGFINWIKTGVYRNLVIDNRWKMIVNGLGVTMTIALLAQVFGTVFGCFICFLLLRKNRIANLVGKVYCALVNGTPVVVLLLISYYMVFAGVNISNILVAVAAFTIVTGAVTGQIFKGSVDTVDNVEIEAARSIGFSATKAFLVVTLPQAVRHALPAYMNSFVELVKATAIVGFIAIQDLTRAGDIIRSRTYDAFFPLIFVAIIYLGVTLTCVWIFKKIINKVSGGLA